MINDRLRSMSARARRSGGSVPSRRQQRGVALLIAILLVAFGTIIAAAMAYDNAMTARRAAATFEFDQALLVAEGAESLAAYGLQQTAKSNPTYTGAGQPWSTPLPPSEVTPGVTLEASLEDLQGRFNINNLVMTDGNTPNTAAIAAFQRLLTSLNLDPKLADLIVDWIDKNTDPKDDGAEDSVYMEMDPPYRTPNLPITSTSELLALPGMTRAKFDTLAPYIVALPLGVQINTCDAKSLVLDALTGHQQWSSLSPKEFAQDRTAAGGCFPTPADVIQAAGETTTGAVGGAQTSTGASTGAGSNVQQGISGMLSEQSRWFRLTSYVTLGTAEFSVYTLLYQDQTGMVRPELRSFTPD
jgi:general secretion pathway protein K